MRCVALVALCATIVGPLAARAQAQVVTNTYVNRGGSLAGKVVTLSRVGAEGDFTSGITPMVNGQTLPAQVDVLRTADDGSIRHALVSFKMPVDLSVGTDQTFDVAWLNQASPPSPGFQIAYPGPFELSLELQPAGGPLLISDPAAVLTGPWWTDPNVRLLHNGRVMKEIEIRDVLTTTPSGAADVVVYWRLRVFSGERSMRVQAIVERCDMYAPWEGRPQVLDFDSVTMRYDDPGDAVGPAVLYSEGAYKHIDRARYRIDVWTEDTIEDIERKPNFDYWVKGRFSPPYVFTNSVNECPYQNLYPDKIDAIYARMPGENVNHIPWGCGGSTWVNDLGNGRNDDVRDQGILEPGIIKDNMSSGGHRWEINPLPAWSIAYAMGGGERTYGRVLHGDGNGAGSFQVHMRSASGEAGYDYHGLAASHQDPQHTFFISNPWALGLSTWPDVAHAPALGYSAYLMTGDLFYAEEIAMWSSYMVGMKNGQGQPSQGIDLNASERAQGWTLRDLVNAAWILPDGHELIPFFEGEVLAYVNKWQSQILPLGRPNHYLREVTTTSGRREWVNAAFCSTWQTAFVLYALGNAVDKGFPQAEPFHAWLGEYIVDLYTSDDSFTAPDGTTYHYDPLDAIPYSTATSLWDTDVVQTAGAGTPLDPSDDIFKVFYNSKIRDLDNLAEAWYLTKLNEDNSWTNNEGLITFPDGGGEWPLRDPGWGHGLENKFQGGNNVTQVWQPDRHGEAGAMGLASAVNGDLPDAVEAWNVMNQVVQFHAKRGTPWGMQILPFQLYEAGTVQNQQLVSLEVVPNTHAGHVGEFVEYRAVGHFQDIGGNSLSLDVTDVATFAIGNPAVAHVAAGNDEIRIDALGSTMIQATHTPTGATSGSAILLGTDDDRPHILYAGWGDSYAEQGTSSTLTIRARIADVDSDTVLVALGRNLMPFAGFALNDNGANGDEKPRDGIFTWTGPSTPGAPATDKYWDVYAFDSTGLGSHPWPYLWFGSSAGYPVSGHPLMPFASETYGQGPRLRATGFMGSRVTNGGPSAVTIVAEASVDPLSLIFCYTDGINNPVPAGMRDDGLGADQFAGDGLWTGTLTLNRTDELYVLDFLPVRTGPLTVGDLYPRFRVHEAP